VILNTANPIANLGHDDIIAIYTGKVDNWQAFEGPDQPITVVNKAEGRSTLELFLQHFQLQNAAIAAGLIIGGNQQGLKTVAGNP
jgi:phosphate transport system substrate-binding protein